MDSYRNLVTKAATANPTIAPFRTNLNGVNQTANLLLADIMLWSIGTVGFLIFGIRIGELMWRKLRWQVSAMSLSGSRQTYWKTWQWSWTPGMKKHLIYAPLWKRRHNKELRLSNANMGTLPSRLHFILLSLYVGSNLAYTLLLNWDNEDKWSFMAELRGRSGTLAIVNMIPLTMFAGRNNPLIGILQISFDTFNLFHRWVGRVSVAETVTHTVAWAVVAHADGGWDLIWEKVRSDEFITSGTVGVVAMVIILILSLSGLRHAFYETFLNVHIILVFATFIGIYMHCITATIPGVGGLPQTTIVIAVWILWFADRVARMIRIIHCNWSPRDITMAVVEPMPGEAVRVTMHLPRYIEVKPGSHAYLRFARANWWESHPFSVARVVYLSEEGDEKHDVSTCVSFVISARSGMTRKLYEAAGGSDEGPPITMVGAFEGPYGGYHSLDSYGHVVLFAGGTGITHQISFLKPLIEGYNSGRVATRKITLVWVIKNIKCFKWVEPWMKKVYSIPNSNDIFDLFICTREPRGPQDPQASQDPQEPRAPMKVEVARRLNIECDNQIGAMCVMVCGPGWLADDVRQAVRNVQGESVVDYIEESFTW